MENNNGRGIFYGVIGVATLVVAIIGATFAYFSASAGSNNAINVGTTKLELAIAESKNFYADMIPVRTKGQESLFASVPGLGKKTDDNAVMGPGGYNCSDIVGNSICGVYEFTISNDNENASQTVFGRMEVTKNGFKTMNTTEFASDYATAFATNAAKQDSDSSKVYMTPVDKSNLHYAMFKGSVAQIVATSHDFKFDPAAVDTNVKNVGVGELVIAPRAIGATGSVESWTDETELLLAPKNADKDDDSVTYTIVLWLEENGQWNAADQDQKFTASIKFDTGSGQGVTGQLSLG